MIFSEASDLHQVLGEIVEAAIEIAGADFGDIQLLDPATSALRIATQRGLPQWWVEYWNSAQRSSGACGAALERGERVIVEDVERSPIFIGTPAFDIQRRADIRAVQSTPIISRSGKPLGVFSTHYKRPHAPNDECTLRLLDLLARHASAIIDRARNETALRESEERLRLALSAGKLGMWDWNVATDALIWSPRQFELFGIRPEDFRKCAAQALAAIHPEDRPHVERAILNARLGSAPFETTFRVVHPDGSVRWLAGLGKVVEDAVSGAHRIIGINYDVSEQKQIELALKDFKVQFEEEVCQRTSELQAQKERLRAIHDNAFDAIVTINSQGIIKGVNQAAEGMFGYAPEELIGQNVKMLMPSPYREEHDGYLRRFRQTGEARIIGRSREIQVRRKDGSLVDVAISVSQAEHLGLFIGIFLDISRQKELEREVLEIASLEDQRIGQDLHDDIGQELSALGLLAGGLTEIVREKLPEEVALAEKIEHAARCVLRKVRALAHGLAVADLAPDELAGALSELANRLSETSQTRFVFLSDLHGSVRDAFQATHLYHIAQEACTNALKHSAALHVEISLRVTDQSVILRIQDDGKGISAGVPDGLGRQIMHNRAKVIGAKLSIESRRPKGTVVQCTLNPDRLRN